jgi:hypothetical protein
VLISWRPTGPHGLGLDFFKNPSHGSGPRGSGPSLGMGTHGAPCRSLAAEIIDGGLCYHRISWASLNGYSGLSAVPRTEKECRDLGGGSGDTGEKSSFQGVEVTPKIANAILLRRGRGLREWGRNQSSNRSCQF